MSDPRQAALGRATDSLYARIGGSAPFNPLPLGIRPRERVLPRQPEGAIEARLVEHIERLTTQSVHAWLDERASDSLLELQELADQHLPRMHWRMHGLALFWPFWLRSPSTWRPDERDPFSSLLEHLLLAYPAPRFLYAAAWDLETVDELRWTAYLIALGQGGSLRRLTELANRRWPEEWAVIPHRLVAFLGGVDPTQRPDRGLMHAEVRRVGGSDVEIRRLDDNCSFWIDPSANQGTPCEREFWRATVGWLVRRRDELEDHEATLILAWARHMQTERQRGGGSFDWRGRTAASALREARAYRESLQHHSRWHAWNHHGWDWQGGVGESEWSIRELTNTTQLQEESQAMSHCVRSYDFACWRGSSAIFSLRQGERRRVTIELQLPSRVVVQAKRACNQEPSELERTIIERWRAHVVAPATSE